MRTTDNVCAAALFGALICATAAAPADARESYGNKWRVTGLEVRGTHLATYDDGDKKLDLDSAVTYNGQRLGKPFELRLSDKRPKVITGPASYLGFTTANYSTPDGSWQCDDHVDADTKLAAVLSVRPSGIRVQWSLAPMGYRCPDEARPLPPSFNVLPTAATVQKLPLRRFKGKSAVLPININWSGGSDGWTQKITWKGKVRISRLKKR